MFFLMDFLIFKIVQKLGFFVAVLIQKEIKNLMKYIHWTVLTIFQNTSVGWIIYPRFLDNFFTTEWNKAREIVNALLQNFRQPFS